MLLAAARRVRARVVAEERNDTGRLLAVGCCRTVGPPATFRARRAAPASRIVLAATSPRAARRVEEERRVEDDNQGVKPWGTLVILCCCCRDTVGLITAERRPQLL